ncbi:hypothetical protein [Fibrella forsythiae]|uniref:Uncharacterized protein n=1 Tax=Fibrella forsythiae TaxID=2817061 RepID=A0ABS3JV26_9BACT|nr:hypothetical protein [Fibrella forsythiae]MBO0953236.1 hypothetical protein [Fibrella forsythiae]
MNRTNVVRSPLVSQGQLLSGSLSRLKQIQDYQNLAKVRLRERLHGSPTSATLYDMLMRDQLTLIKSNPHA